MAVDGNLIALPGAIASADMSADIYRFVSLVTTGGTPTGTVAKSAAAGAIGVLYNNPKAGQSAHVVIGGIAKVIAGGTVAIGAKVDSNGAGAAVATATALHTAMSAGASGDVIEVMLVAPAVLV